MTRDDGSGTIGGRNDGSPYASGQRKTLSSPKNQSTPMDKISTYTRKIEYNEEPPPSDILSRSRMMIVTDGILGGRLLRIELWNMK